MAGPARRADPVFDPTTWHFKTGGLVEAPLTLNWTHMSALPRVEIVTDFHCVTRWSTFDNRVELDQRLRAGEVVERGT